METKNRAGFEEIQHTADWALRVWAPDLVELFRQAAAGMQTLMDLRSSGETIQQKEIECSAIDYESLLVTFLSEILYWIESEGLACQNFNLVIEGFHLSGTASCKTVESMTKVIKAVTFHNLQIVKRDGLFETTIVFDV